jgi:hypothetical protein
MEFRPLRAQRQVEVFPGACEILGELPAGFAPQGRVVVAAPAPADGDDGVLLGGDGDRAAGRIDGEAPAGLGAASLPPPRARAREAGSVIGSEQEGP